MITTQHRATQTVHPRRSNPLRDGVTDAPLPRFVVDFLDRKIASDSELRDNHPSRIATVVAVGFVLSLVSLVILAVNVRTADVWLLGFELGVPLVVQWVLCFLAGVVVALRIKRRDDRKYNKPKSPTISETGS